MASPNLHSRLGGFTPTFNLNNSVTNPKAGSLSYSGSLPSTGSSATAVDSFSFSPAAVKHLENIVAICERDGTTAREFLNSIALREPDRSPCCSEESFYSGLLEADATLEKEVFDEIYGVIKTTCETHKDICVQPVRFDEAVVNVRNHELHRNRRSADVGKNIFRNAVFNLEGYRKEGEHSGAPGVRAWNSPNNVATRGYFTVSPKGGMSGVPAPGSTRPRPEESDQESLANSGKRARILNLSSDMRSFLELGGDKETGVLTREAFTQSIRADGLAHGWKVPDELIAARWNKVDSLGNGVIDFRQYQEAFLMPKLHQASGSKDGLGDGKVGLVNMGNTCYLNSSIQCLRACRDLSTSLLDREFVERQINRDGFLGSKGDVATRYCELLSLLQSSTKSSELPREFRSAVAKVGQDYAGSRQQDAQEFIGFLLDILHEDFNRVKKKPYIEQKDITDEMLKEKGYERCAALEWYHYLKRDKSIIVDSFQGQLKSVIKCSACKYALTKFESFMFLSVPTMTASDKKLESLIECLNEFSSAEVLTGDNKWYCQKCKEHRDAEKTIHIWKLPKYLIVHLKRFTTKKSASLFSFSSSTTFTKLAHDVSIPMALKFTSVLPTESPQKMSPNFRLVSFVKHFGSVSYGHYTAYCRHADDSWQLYDDDSVSTIPMSEVPGRAKDSYVYFFERCHSPLQDDVLNLEDEVGPLRQTQSRPDLWPHIAEHGRQWSFLTDDVSP